MAFAVVLLVSLEFPPPLPFDTGTFGACWQNRLSISLKSILALFGPSFSFFFTILDQIFFLPQILFTGNLFQLKVFILCFGLGVSSWGKWVGVVGPAGGAGGPLIPPGGGGGGGGPPPPGGGGGGGGPPKPFGIGGGGGGGGPDPPGGGGGGGGGGAPPPGGGGGGGGGIAPPGGGGGGGGMAPTPGGGGGGGGGMEALLF